MRRTTRKLRAILPIFIEKVFLTNKLHNCDCRLRIELLFNYHGDQYKYKIGETESHEDATENEYASDTKTEIWLDPDTYEYGISADVYSYIPREDIKVLLGNLIEYFTDDESAKDVRGGLDTEFDSQVTTDGVYNSYVRISYFND